MNHKHLAQHLLVHLMRAQIRGRRISLEDLALCVRARRGDVRTALSNLHKQGLFDVLRSRLTLLGFAVARGIDPAILPNLRSTRPVGAVAA